MLDIFTVVFCTHQPGAHRKNITQKTFLPSTSVCETFFVFVVMAKNIWPNLSIVDHKLDVFRTHDISLSNFLSGHTQDRKKKRRFVSLVGPRFGTHSLTS